jgi:hypothetical protein
MLDRIVQRLAQLPDRGVQADVELDVRPGFPQSLPDHFAADYFTGTAEQQLENLKRLMGKPDSQTVLAELARLRVELEHAEPKNPSRDGSLTVPAFLRGEHRTLGIFHSGLAGASGV